MARILLMNIPAGPFPSDYPPVAISRVMEGIDSSLGCEAAFLNLDFYRLPFEEIAGRIKDFSPDIIGISAMLTPSYSYVKRLSNFIGERFPHVVQVLGGQMNVIANIILLRTKVMFCVIGESEPVFSSLIRLLKEDGFRPVGMERYAQIKGLVFLRDNAPFFTGYGTENKESGVRQFNYSLISRFTSLENYIHRIDGQYFKVRLPNSSMEDLMKLFRPENIGKNLATAFTSKGCVNRCTFCHRFTKGYQVIGNDDVISYIEALKKDQNVGMLLFSEENFGNHKKSTAALVEYLRTSGINWAAPAVRVRSINEEMIRSWKDAGCVHVNFGIESLSQKILDVMEKNSTVEENMEAIRLCYRYGIFTVLGLVIGMPGETEETIEETISNLSAVIPDDISIPFEVYINFVQAIPGTPVYEYARKVGLIGNSIDEEERYIEGLYDIDANEIRHYLNFTDYGKEELAYWKYYISMELVTAYIRKNGFFNVLGRKRTRPYRIGLAYSLIPKGIRKPALKYALAIKTFGIGSPLRIFHKKLKRLFTGESARFSFIDRSLRKINRELPDIQRGDDTSTAVLRESR
ncbi:MAG: radical SAM protein [Deltaproteobacteria bacterium]|nr:radical SAM protein [Deltaproteobacteria bacterium]